MKKLKPLIIILITIMALQPDSASGANRDKKVVDFNYPQDVSKTALSDLDRALGSGDGRLVVDAIVRYAIAQSGISPDNMADIVSRIESTLEQEQRPEYRALLHYFEACVFNAYRERYGVHDRSNPDADPTAAQDYSQWDNTRLQRHIGHLLSQALSQPDALQGQRIGQFQDIIRHDQQGALLVPTLYQFVCDKALELTRGTDLGDEIGRAWRQSVEGDVPAYIYACLQSNSVGAKQLYERFKDNEHSGLALLDCYDTEIYTTLKDYVARFPRGYYTRSIQNKINQIESKTVNLSYDKHVHSGEQLTVVVHAENVNRLTLQVYRVPEHLGRDTHRLSLKSLKPVQSKAVVLQGTVPFAVTNHTVALDPLPYGRYVVVPTYVADGHPQTEPTVDQWQLFTVGDLALFYASAVGDNNRLFAVDHRTGAPAAGVKVTGKQFRGTTDGDGCIVVPGTLLDDEFRASRGDDRHGSTLNYHRIRRENFNQVSARVFTDLAIYRPGETMHVATIFYHRDSTSRSVMANEPIRITLTDNNDQMVGHIDGTTDEYGRLTGEFRLPTDRMNGRWNLKVAYGRDYHLTAAWHSINVSEYKTPTFVVTYPEAKPSYVRRQPVKIQGKAETYSGMPLANAQVKLTLRQKPWAWWWRSFSTRDQGTVLHAATVTTDERGQFIIELADTVFAESDDKLRWARYTYSLQAQVTDGAGETQEATHTFIVGTRRGIELPSRLTYVNEKPLTLPLKYNTTSETDTTVACTWQLTPTDSEAIVASGHLMSDRPTIELSAVPSGQYELKVHILDAEPGEEEVDATAVITLYRKSDRQAPVRDCTLWTHSEANHIDSNNVGHILVGTSAPEAHIYYVASDRQKVVGQGWLHYRPGLHELQLDVPTDADNFLSVELMSYHNGTVGTQSVRLTSPAADRSLRLHATSFRDHLLPGQTERWTFRLTDKDANSRRGALLLAMTDKAIDDISQNHWELRIALHSPQSYTLQTMRIDEHCYSELHWSAKNARENTWQVPLLYTYDQNLFGFLGRGRILYKNAAVQSAMPTPVGSFGSIAEESDMVLRDMATSENADDMVMEEKSIAAGSGQLKRLDDIHLRQADVKTALWMPLLSSDSEGNVVVEFEAPEFNTTWILQAIGLDKQLYSDRLERQVVTQKPIMVKSSLPRFVRQGDQVTLSANVQNASDTATTADAVIELFDPRTGHVHASQNYHPQLAAHASQAVSIRWDVPEDASFVGFRIKAATDQFGDGEQVMVPVLPAVQPVIETQPFYIEAAAPRFALQLPPSARNARVTLEYCDNPMWYCVTALPTIYDDHCVTASSLAHTLFAIEVAQGVAHQQPQVRQAIAHWKANEQDSTLVSMLAKNQDLKIGTLLASPWGREADRQTLRMSRLDLLLDTQLMDKERARVITSLADLQMGDGGFTWFRYPDCRSSYYTTHEVLELVGELRHLGYLHDHSQLINMITRALRYYDRETLRQYKLRHDKTDYSGFSAYVYVRSLFPTVAMDREVQTLFDNALKQMAGDWSRGLSLGEKAFYALALNRNGHRTTARDIIESIRQFAITKPALGTYWDNLQVGWRYLDKVAVTATILQALNECDPRQDEIDSVRKWLLLMKQSNDWGSSSLAADAVYALLTTGSQWLEQNAPARITIAGQPLPTDGLDQRLGYVRKTIDAAPGTEIAIERNGNSPAWGAVYCQFQAPMTDIAQVAIDQLSISKDYSVVGADGQLSAATRFAVGDRVRVRLIIRCDRDLDFVTVVDERAACFEPVDKLSGHRIADHMWYYHETKDAQTRLFISDLQKGTHVISYDVYVTAAGAYSAGIASAQCQYAPQIAAHSAGQTLTVK